MAFALGVRSGSLSDGVARLFDLLVAVSPQYMNDQQSVLLGREHQVLPNLLQELDLLAGAQGGVVR
ncbi:MAG: hypothetical protein IT530_16300 [Burkholderiales bacterium]|nr:hypothetical protein [Burkholderiales bacterium]